LPEALAGVPVREELRRARAELIAAGCDTPRLDAELLLAFVLGVGRERLVLEAPAALDKSVLEHFQALVARRVLREPVAYILGRKEFRRISLTVDERVLIPRPESELLVEVGLSCRARARVVDVGTGSGAVALALKDERPDLSVVGTDVSADALAVARENARRLGLEVQFRHADLLVGVPGDVDAVLANLPYVAEGRVVPPEVALYEPPSALFAGSDGLAVVRRLLRTLAGVSLVALEVGFDQADEVADLLCAAGFRSVERVRDLAGHERVLVGRK
jgi:release factor glutamine methyltransferase